MNDIQRSIAIGMVMGFILAICFVAGIIWMMDSFSFTESTSSDNVSLGESQHTTYQPTVSPAVTPTDNYNRTEFICQNLNNAKTIQPFAGLGLNTLNLVNNIQIKDKYIVLYKELINSATSTISSSTDLTNLNIKWKEYYTLSEPINQFVLNKVEEYSDSKILKSEYNGVIDSTEIYFNDSNLMNKVMEYELIGISSKSLYFIIGLSCYDSYFIVYKSTKSSQFRKFALDKTGGFSLDFGYNDYIKSINTDFFKDNIVWREDYMVQNYKIVLYKVSQMLGVQGNDIVWKEK